MKHDTNQLPPAMQVIAMGSAIAALLPFFVIGHIGNTLQPKERRKP